MNRKQAFIFICLIFINLQQLYAEDNEKIAEVAHHDFFVVTPEKTGTHLLTKALTQLLNKPCINCWQHEISRKDLIALLKKAKNQNAYVQMHALPTKQIIRTLRELKYKVLFLMRDPRDQAVSLLHYILKGWKYGPLDINQPFGRLSFDEKLHEIITGKRYGTSATESILGRRIPWMYQDQNFALTLYFENLVGSEGGGSREDQLNEINQIVSFIEADLPVEEIEIRSQGLFGKPGEKTFRKGQIGSWKEYFKPVHKKAMKKVFGKELIKLGYENSSKW